MHGYPWFADRRRALVAALVAALLQAPVAAGAVTLLYPAASQHDHHAADPAGDSNVFLAPDPVENSGELFLQSSVSQAMKDELAGGDTDFSGWTFDYDGGTLAGTITIDEYEAAYSDDHVGGGRISIRYEKGVDDPETLRWVQLITTTDALGGATSPYIDPHPNDDDSADGPFYYCDPPGDALCDDFDIADHVDGAEDYGFGTDYDLHFFDFSRREHEMPFENISWTAELWLVSWDEATTVTFHDGIEWGWVMTPEPSSALLVLVGLVGLAGRAGRRTARR